VRHRSRRSPRIAAIAAALGALALLGIVLAAVVGRGGDEALPPTTVVRTATVAGETQVRTVTVEAQPVTPPPSSTAAVAVTAPSSTSGSALNDQGFRLLKAGDASGALPILERAVAALQGSGSVTEAYALYNLALARFSTGDCNGVKELLDGSERIQGDRREIKDLRHQVDKGCKR
jgi:hypothetical protein